MIFNANVAETIKNPETLLRCTKVWENSNSSLPFTAQTVSLTAVTDVVFYIVEYKPYYGNNGVRSTTIIFPNHNTTIFANYYESGSAKFVVYSRNVTITSNAAVFNDDSVEGELGEYIVPITIYAMHN